MPGYDKDGNKLDQLTDVFDVWDRKEYTYDELQHKLFALQDSDSLKGILDKCTLCPVHNATCNSYFEIHYTGYNPDLGHKTHKLMIFPHGVKEWEKCPLSK